MNIIIIGQLEQELVLKCKRSRERSPLKAENCEKGFTDSVGETFLATECNIKRINIGVLFLNMIY